MPANIRSVGSSNSSTNLVLSFSPTMPTGFVAGDLLIGFAANSGGDVPANRPSGSTGVINVDDGTVLNLDVVRKVAAGGDVFTWTVTPTARKWAGCVIAVAAGSYDPVTPISGAVGLAVGTTAVTTIPTGSSTPGNVHTLMISAFALQAANTWSTTDTSPSMVEIADTASTSTTPASLGVYRSLWSPPMSSMTRSAVSTVSSANGGAVILFVNQATPVEWGQRSPRPVEGTSLVGPHAAPPAVSQIF